MGRGTPWRLFRHEAVFTLSDSEDQVTNITLGGSPGLVVMGDNSCSRGRGFESRHRLLDEHLFGFICCKICIVSLKRPKIKQKKRQGLLVFLKKL